MAEAIGPGSIIDDRFVVESFAGRGGMGVVFRARDQLSGARVALKLMLDGSDVTRFRRETKILGTLDHPGIVRHVAHGETSAGEPYLVMEWIEGESLAARLRRGPLSAADAVEVVRGAAHAAAAAHALGVVHRDIKPSNLIVAAGQPKAVKLLDFGTAWLAHATTLTRGALGTLGYMAPEQARGEEDIDARADVFALGLVLYECLTGKPAFEAAHPMALLTKVLLDEPLPLREACPGLPPELYELEARMLAKRREDRPRDAAEPARLLDEIASVLRDAPSPASPAPPERPAAEERLLFSLIAASASCHGPTLAVGTHDTPRSELVRAALQHGCEPYWLADGTLVCALRVLREATDLAVRAARCALALRRLWPEATFAVTMGRGTLSSASPTGEAIDRAVELLARASEGASAPGNEIFVDDLTAQLLHDRFTTRAETRGTALVSERDEWGGCRQVLGKRLPFVGRDRELAELEALYDECIDEHLGRVALITAPPGMGKTRLAGELIGRLRARGARFEVWLARGEALGNGSQLSLVAALVRDVCGAREGDSVERQQQKVRERVERGLAGQTAERVTEFLCELIRAPFSDADRPLLRHARRVASEMGEQLGRAFQELVAAECEAAPLIIVVEDLQWADLSSLKYLETLLGNPAARPLLLLALARPEVHETFPRLWRRADVTEVRLAPLRDRAADALVRSALDDAPAERRAQIVSRAAGNVFFLEELIRAVADESGGGLPDTVLAIVQARIGKLPAPARAILRAGSIFGVAFWAGACEALLRESARESNIAYWLDELVEREFLVARSSSSFKGETEVAFRHALVRDGAYAMLTDEDRVLGHRVAGEWLERAGEVDGMILAEHFERGGLPMKAVSLHVVAAEQAIERDDVEATLAAVDGGLAAGATGGDREALLRARAVAEARRGAQARPAMEGRGPARAEPEPGWRFAILPGRVFYAEAVGRWSKETTARYLEELRAAQAPLLGEGWVYLNNIDRWLPTHPDAVQLIIDFLHWCVEARMAYVAYVISDPQRRLETRLQVSRIFETSGIAPIADFFATESEAEAWLRRMFGGAPTTD